MAITGDTGSGKTTLADVLLHFRGYTLALRSKADDAHLIGAKISRAAHFASRPDVDRWLLDPPYEYQLEEFWNAFEKVWKQGYWTIYLDELFYLSKLRDARNHKLNDQIEKMLTQGRSKKITVVAGMQRPVQVTRFALSQATHIISFTGENRDAKILKESVNEDFGNAVMQLPRYSFAWYYRPKREIWIGNVQELLGITKSGGLT